MEQLQKRTGRKNLDLSGGESVYCINQGQMAQARQLIAADSERSKLFTSMLDDIKRQLSRNEQAALAFVLIDELNSSR